MNFSQLILILLLSLQATNSFADGDFCVLNIQKIDGRFTVGYTNTPQSFERINLAFEDLWNELQVFAPEFTLTLDSQNQLIEHLNLGVKFSYDCENSFSINAKPPIGDSKWHVLKYNQGENFEAFLHRTFSFIKALRKIP